MEHMPKDVIMAYNIAIHALQEYRQWRDNAYIGQNLGNVRDAYVVTLRRRMRDAIEAYRMLRTLMSEEREAA